MSPDAVKQMTRVEYAQHRQVMHETFEAMREMREKENEAGAG